MADSNVAIVISADTARATAGLATFNAKVREWTAELNRATAAINKTIDPTDAMIARQMDAARNLAYFQASQRATSAALAEGTVATHAAAAAHGAPSSRR